MNKMIIVGLCSIVATACSTNKTEPKTIGMPNPATEYCIVQGGTSEMVKDEKGWYGLCHLPDGKVIEEWQLYRSANK